MYKALCLLLYTAILMSMITNQEFIEHHKRNTDVFYTCQEIMCVPSLKQRFKSPFILQKESIHVYYVCTLAIT